MSIRSRAYLTAALLALVTAPGVHAFQTRPYSPEEERWLDAGWKEDVVFAASNALMSGLVTGLFRVFSDGSFGEGFRTGAAGGVVAYAGKRLAAQRFAAAGLVGRQVASVGGSIAANARDGRGTFDRLIVPLGLGRLYWDRVESRVTVRPDVVTVYYTVLGVASSRVDLDWSRTLSAGTPVFVTRPGATGLDDNAAGRAFGGVVLVDVNADVPIENIMAHERVHVLQYDQQLALWGEPAERGLGSLFGERAASVLGHADLGIGLLPFAPFRGLLPRRHNPIEIEADYLTVR